MNTSYLDWQPALSAEDVFKSTIGFTFIQADQFSNAYWVEPRPEEGGRAVLVQREASGKIRDLTPKPFSVRTRVMEYGSRPYVVHGTYVYFVNFEDQRLYKQSLETLDQFAPGLSLLRP